MSILTHSFHFATRGSGLRRHCRIGMWAKQELNRMAIRLRFLVADDHIGRAGRRSCAIRRRSLGSAQPRGDDILSAVRLRIMREVV